MNHGIIIALGLMILGGCASVTPLSPSADTLLEGRTSGVSAHTSASGGKKIKQSSKSDFDFVIGQWHVEHQRLKENFTGSTQWYKFSGTSITRKILGGYGNIEDNFLALPDGDFRAASVRTFNSKTKQWAIWWLDMRNPSKIDVPVVGEFTNGKGIFYADEIIAGIPVKVRFSWVSIDHNSAKWEQEFSNDAGNTWEKNWIMNFTRIKE